jgi:hypothetical protein
MFLSLKESDWEVEGRSKKLPPWEPSRRIARTQTLAPFILATAGTCEQMMQFFDRVEEIHWIDCHRFPTDRVVVEVRYTKTDTGV